MPVLLSGPSAVACTNTMKFEHTIEAESSFFRSNIKEAWKYRDLMLLFVHRDFVAKYKQTILGPVWFLINPIAQTLIFTFIFGGIAGIPTDGLPNPLFYMAGVTCWTFFSVNLTTAAALFYSNVGIFGKVYYPRIITILSATVGNLIQFFLQLSLLVVLIIFYAFKGVSFRLNLELLLFPLILLLMIISSLGIGMCLTALTTKYRDFRNLVTWGVQLFMYATPIVYPLSVVEERLKSFHWLVTLNPMTSVVESFRGMLFATNEIPYHLLLYSSIVSVTFLALGIWIFGKVERNFIDTV